MKKFIESRFGLAGFFLLLNVIALIIPNCLGRVIVFAGVFMFQFILAGNDKYLEWNFYNSFSYNYSNRKLIFRNLLFSLASWFTMVNFIYCSLIFNPEIKGIGFLLILLFSFLSLSLMLLHYLKSKSYIRLRGLLVAPVLVGIVFSLFLNFGTQFIWLPIILFFMISILSAFEELNNTLSKKKNRHIINLALIFLVAIGLISTIIQFWSVIYLGLIFSILGISLWIWILAVIFGIYVKWGVKKYQQLEVKIKKELLSDKKKNEKRVVDLSDPTYDHVCVHFDDVLFIAKLYNARKLPKDFNFTKILRFNLVGIVKFSQHPDKLVFPDNLREILIMYNCLYKKEYSQEIIDKLNTNLALLCHLVELRKKCIGASALKNKIKENCPNLPDYPWTF